MMQKSPLHIHVSVRNQELKLRRGRKIIRRYPVSTSRFGLGSEEGSNKTPLGRFRVSDKIEESMPAGTIFVRPRPAQTGRSSAADTEIWSCRGFSGSTVWKSAMPIPAIVLFTFTGQSTRTKSASPTATDVSGCETQMSSSF